VSNLAITGKKGRQIGILTGGGDAPGLNAVIRGIVHKAKALGYDVLGFLNGWDGLLGECRHCTLDLDIVEDIHMLGGTILHTSRTNPYKVKNGPQQVKNNLKKLKVDCLIAIGGEDTLGVANKLSKDGIKVIGVPITIDNDANVFTLAEAILGAGKKYQNVIGLTLGTGVGGGIVINKKIYHGRGNAGELGYLLQNQSGPRGQLGENGALQEFIRAGVLIKNKKITVAALAREHNPRANKIWQEFGSHLGYALASISHIFDPDVIILGGQIAKAWPRFYSSLQKSLNKNCILPKTPIIKRAALGDSAGVIGAALLANLPYANS